MLAISVVHCNASSVFGFGLRPNHGRRLNGRLFYSPAHDRTVITSL
jgi:hypothetical protein